MKATRTRIALVFTAMVAVVIGTCPAVGATPSSAGEPSNDGWRLAIRSEPMGERWMPAQGRRPVDSPLQDDGRIVGRIRIPAVGLDQTVREGVAQHVIDQGPAHWAGTAMPGAEGNVVIAGHRTTHGAPFHDLDTLAAGDVVYVGGTDGTTAIYAVVDRFVVTPDDVWITWDNGLPYLTLFACHPLGSAAQRIVIRAELLSTWRLATDEQRPVDGPGSTVVATPSM